MRKFAVLLSAVGVGIGGIIFACGSSDPALPDLPRNDAGIPESGPTEGSPGDGNIMGAAEAFCRGTLGAYSALVNSCCNVTDKALPQGAQLVSRAQSNLAACVTAIGGSVTKGRTMYQQAQAQACIGDYMSKFGDMSLCATLQTIDPTAEPNALCAIAFVGLGENNALCSADLECKDGLTCVGYGGGNDGTCRTPAGAGGACGSLRSDGSLGALVMPMGSHPACAAGFYCDSTSNCKAQISPGTGPCTRNDQCLAPSRCDGAGKCTSDSANALSAMLQPCNTTVDCVVGLWCDHNDMDGGLQPVGRCQSKRSVSDPCLPSEVGTCTGLCSSSFRQCVAFCGAT